MDNKSIQILDDMYMGDYGKEYYKIKPTENVVKGTTFVYNDVNMIQESCKVYKLVNTLKRATTSGVFTTFLCENERANEHFVNHCRSNNIAFIGRRVINGIMEKRGTAFSETFLFMIENSIRKLREKHKDCKVIFIIDAVENTYTLQPKLSDHAEKFNYCLILMNVANYEAPKSDNFKPKTKLRYN